jgi:RNA polymerase sigma factor (sigma-70 family)
MKKYNIQNYIRYKEDLKSSIYNLEGKFWDEYTRDELIIKFMPLVENLARKFATSQQASGVLSINDLIQEGNKGLVLAVDKLDWSKLNDSADMEKTLKSFFSKRIKGAIRRAMDINRGNIRIPEHKLNEIRKNPENKKIVSMFFNSIFSSIDENYNSQEENPIYNIPDKSKKYNLNILNTYLLSLMKQHLTGIEYEVLRLSFGLDCDKHSANYIADKLNINTKTAKIKVSQLKKQAINKLIENVEHSQVIDYL